MRMFRSLSFWVNCAFWCSESGPYIACCSRSCSSRRAITSSLADTIFRPVLSSPSPRASALGPRFPRFFGDAVRTTGSCGVFSPAGSSAVVVAATPRRGSSTAAGTTAELPGAVVPAVVPGVGEGAPPASCSAEAPCSCVGGAPGPFADAGAGAPPVSDCSVGAGSAPAPPFAPVRLVSSVVATAALWCSGAASGAFSAGSSDDKSRFGGALLVVFFDVWVKGAPAFKGSTVDEGATPAPSSIDAGVSAGAGAPTEEMSAGASGPAEDGGFSPAETATWAVVALSSLGGGPESTAAGRTAAAALVTAALVAAALAPATAFAALRRFFLRPLVACGCCALCDAPALSSPSLFVPSVTIFAHDLLLDEASSPVGSVVACSAAACWGEDE